MPLYYNASNRPIVRDDDGRSLGAGEWVESELTDQIYRAIENGEIVVVKVPEPESKPRSRRRTSE